MSEQRIKRILRNPLRREEGVAPKTIAVMQPTSVRKKNGKDVWSQELWVMFETKKTKNPEDNTALQFDQHLKIISAWRYPGMSPLGTIPEEMESPGS